MGLDMYLEQRHYVGNKHRKRESRLKIIEPKDKTGKLFQMDKIDQKHITHVRTEAGYWRKANHIHKWFVDNVQGGEDDCKPYRVHKKQLKELLDSVDKVLESTTLIEATIRNGYTTDDKGNKIWETEKGKKLKNKTIAKKLLPTTDGFFFGGAQYDQWYWEDLQDTKKILEKAMKQIHSDFYYRASW